MFDLRQLALGAVFSVAHLPPELDWNRSEDHVTDQVRAMQDSNPDGY